MQSSSLQGSPNCQRVTKAYQLLEEKEGHQYKVVSFCELGNGYVASGSSDAIKIWDSDFKEVKTLNKSNYYKNKIGCFNDNPPQLIKWLEKCQRLVTLSEKVISIWGISDINKPLCTIPCKYAHKVLYEFSNKSFVVLDKTNLKIIDPEKKFACKDISLNDCTYALKNKFFVVRNSKGQKIFNREINGVLSASEEADLQYNIISNSSKNLIELSNAKETIQLCFPNDKPAKAIQELYKLSNGKILCGSLNSIQIWQPQPAILHLKSNVPSIAFPIEDLECLLEFIEEINFKKMLEKEASGKVKETGAFSFFNLFLKCDTENPVIRTLAANLTWTTFCSLLSKSELSLSNGWSLFENWRNGEDIYQPSEDNFGKKLNGVIKSATKLSEFINKFYIDQTLDFSKLIVNLLKDGPLFEFLVNGSITQQISGLIAAAHLPGLDQKIAGKCIDLLIRLQEIVLNSHKKDEILNLLALGNHLFENEFLELTKLVNKVLHLMKKLEKIVKIFLEPQIVGIQTLALPVVMELLKKGKSWGPKDIQLLGIGNKSFYNCQERFDKFKSTDLKGWIATPIEFHINSRILDRFYFTSKREEGVKDSLCIENAKELYFKQFTFKNSQFHDFDFTQTCFETCDFSDVIFSGTITFSETYMDSNTAKTFFAALIRAVSCDEKLQIMSENGIVLYSSEENKNEELIIPEAFTKYIKATQNNLFAVEAFLPVVVQEQNPNQPAQEPTILDALWSGLKDVGTNVVNTVSELGADFVNYVRGTEEEHAEAVLENIQQEMKENDDIVKLIEKLNEEISATKMEQQKQANAINMISEHVKQLQNEKAEKFKIKQEQEKLLARKDQVTAFYQTFLTQLCSSLQAILILQSKISLIKPIQGVATNISNKQTKFGSFLEIASKDTSKVDEAFKWLNAIKDHAIGVTGCLKPLIPLIPNKIAKIICEKGVNLLEIANDKGKVKNTNDAFHGLTVKTLEKIADAIARKLAFAYEGQIQLLSNKGAILFAEGGVLRIVAALFNGYIKTSSQFATEAWLAIRRLETIQNATFLGIEIPFTHRRLESNDKKRWYKADELYRRTGITYFDCTWVCYSNDKIQGKPPLPKALVTKAKKLGYMHISKEEWQKDFSHSMAKDDQQSPLALSSTNNDLQSVVSNPVQVKNHPDRKVPLETLKIENETLRGRISQLEIDNAKFRTTLTQKDEEIKRLWTEVNGLKQTLEKIINPKQG